MPLTPADVHNVVFKKPPIGKRGYDEDEVDAFLDVVEAELARLKRETEALEAPDEPEAIEAAPPRGEILAEEPEQVTQTSQGTAGEEERK